MPFLFWNVKVFLRTSIRSKFQLFSQIFYYHNLFSTSFSNLISTLYACFTTTCSCLYLTQCLYFSEQAGHNTEACCIVLVLSISKCFLSEVPFVFGWTPLDDTLLLTLWIHLWCCDVFQTLSEPRYYKFSLVSSIFNSFKEKNPSMFLRTWHFFQSRTE